MKYSVEFNNQNSVFTETLEIDGHVVQRRWKRHPSGFVMSALLTSDPAFSKQFELLDEEQCKAIGEFFEKLTVVGNMEKFIDKYCGD